MTLELSTAGESHGPALVGILTGLPAGLTLDREAIQTDLARRQEGYGRSPRQQIETDQVEVLAGLRHGRTLGTPLALVVPNRDHKNWTWGMSPWAPEGDATGKGKEAVTLPRPGHADLAGVMKYGHDDVRNALERASARHTAVIVAAGAVAKALLHEIGEGFALAGLRGSEAHDEILRDEAGYRRETNRAGGIEAGVSNGEEIIVRAAMKPLPTLMRPLRSADLATGEPAEALVERSDVAAVEALAVVAEACVALELARAAKDKFGGDAVGDFVAAYRAYVERIPWSAR